MARANQVLQTANVGGLAVLLGVVVSTPTAAQGNGRIQARATVLRAEPAADGLGLAQPFLAARREGRMERRFTTVQVTHERRTARRAPLVRVAIQYLRN